MFKAELARILWQISSSSHKEYINYSNVKMSLTDTRKTFAIESAKLTEGA